MVYISHFLLAFAVSYVGSIPPGMLNLTAIEITRTEKLIGAWLFALACGFIEFFQGFLALKFSDFLTANQQIECYIQVSVIPIFLILSIIYFRQKPPKTQKEQSNTNKTAFYKGIVLSLANPLAVIFWLVWGTYFSQQGLLILDNWHISIFMFGVSVGTVATLMTYSFLSEIILKKIGSFSRWINQIIGVILLSLVFYQIYIVITKDYLSCL
ncbi:MAG: LysE family translocator [Saprospiraceae bacterium]